MKKEIKERIEAVRRGEVPDGYRRTRAGLMPLDWQGNLAAKDVFRNYSNKKHNGEFQVLSATQDRGIIPRSEVDIDIKFAEENVGSYKKVDSGDFVISLRSFQGGIEYSEYEGLVSPAYTVLKATRPISDNYYRAYFKTPDFISRLNGAVYGIRDGKQIGYEDFGELAVHYPPLTEQQKIAEILATCDRVIELKQQLLEEKRHQKQWLMYMIFEEQCLMPETTKELSFDEVFTTCSTRGHQIKTDQYVAKGLYPVVDQGKRPVVAFSDDKSKLLKCPQTGLIVFGDHTKELKFVDFDFIVGADGVQLICAKESVLTTEFGYYLLSAKKLPDDGYSRHFKYLKEFIYSVPDRDTQNQISSILRVIDKEIVLLETEFELWQQKKKALMQLLLTGLVRVNA